MRIILHVLLEAHVERKDGGLRASSPKRYGRFLSRGRRREGEWKGGWLFWPRIGWGYGRGSCVRADVFLRAFRGKYNISNGNKIKIPQ